MALTQPSDMEELRQLRAAANEHRRTMLQVWSARFQVTTELEVGLLKQAHRYVLRELMEAWDSSRFAEGLPAQRTSLHHLPAHLLAKVIKAAVHDSYGLLCFQQSARVRCVSRAFEALAYDVVTRASVETPVEDGACPACERQLPLLALSSGLADLNVDHEPRFNIPEPLAPFAAAALPHCTHLTRLTLQQVSDETGSVVARCTGLVQLCVNHGGHFLPAALRSLPKLAQLTLSSVRLPSAFLAALRAATALTCLSLHSVQSPVAWIAIACLPQLRKLSVYSTRWGAVDVAALPDAARLEVLTIYYFSGDADGLVGAAEQRLFAKLLPRFRHLRSLVMGIPWRRAATASELAAALQRLPKLTRLELPMKADAPAAHAAMVPALPRFPALQALELNLCDLEDDRVGAALPRCAALTKLVVHNDGVRRDRVLRLEPVVSVLRRCACLRSVTVSFGFCYVSNGQVAVACCRAAAGHPSLVELTFGCIVDERGRRECEALCQDMPNVVLSWKCTEDEL